MVHKIRSAIAFIIKNPVVIFPPLFYVYTCAPTIGLGDTALLIENIQDFKINTHVNNHNITILLGRLFSYLPIGDIAYRANLMSAFAGSLAVAFFYFLVYRNFGSRLTASICTLIFMVSNSMWWHSTISEIYAVNALLTIILLLLFQALQKDPNEKYLLALFFLSGLAFFNHVQLGSFLAGSSACLGWKILEDAVPSKKGNKTKPAFFGRSFRIVTLCAIFFLIGFLPYLLTFLKDVRVNQSFQRALSLASGGDFRGIMFKGTLLYGLKEISYLIFKQFPSFYLPCVVIGLFIFLSRWRLSKSTIGILTVFMINTWFFMFYNTWDKFAFLLPSFTILAFWGSYAVDAFLKYTYQKKSKVLASLGLGMTSLSIVFPPYFYSQLSHWGSDPNSRWYRRYNNLYTINTHNISEYIANPNKRHYTDVREFADLIFAKLPQNAVLIDDDSRTFFPLQTYYQKYYQKRLDLDIQLINSWGFKDWGAGKDEFAIRLKDAYETNKDFFLISLNHPFYGFLSRVPEKEKYLFGRFPLDEKRWVYRLVTAKEAGITDESVWSLWDELDPQKPLRLNVTDKNVLFVREGVTSMQETYAFGDDWEKNDHLFFSPQKLQAEVAFLLRMKDKFECDVTLVMTTANDFGVVDFYLNNKEIANRSPIDLYSKNVSVKPISLKKILFEKGNNIFAVKVLGKNPISAAMKMGLDTIDLEKCETK